MADEMTPAGWLRELEGMLDRQQQQIRPYLDYYDGRHKLAFATSKFRQAFGSLFAAFSDNWCQIVVDAAVERLGVQGFRFGAEGEAADNDAWAIWQANSLDAESVIAHTEAVKCGRAFLLVAPNGDQPARVTVEHPSQVVVAHASGDRRARVAALKKWVDRKGFAVAYLYLPEAVFVYRSQQKVQGGGQISWQALDAIPNPLEVVPVVPLYNNPSMLDGGESDLGPAIDLNTAIDKLASDMLVASEYGAFQQRWAAGLEVPTGDDGEPVPSAELKAAMSRLWVSADPETKFGAFPATDLNNYVVAIEMLVQHLAAQTRTPPHYLLAKMVNLSGDALKAAEVGLVARVKRKQVDFAEGWEEAIRLAFKARNPRDKRAQETQAETIWQNPEYRTEGQVVDALVKLRQLGLPIEAAWEIYGFTPQQIERFKVLAGLPDRPPPGATTADVPPVLGGSGNGASANTAATAG